MPDLTIEIDQGDVAKLFARLNRATATATLRVPIENGAERMRSDLADYPEPAHKRQPAKSRKQQIKQIMLAKEGKIPYRRTGHLGRSWTVSVFDEGEGVEATIGNAVVSPEGTRYGPLVQGEEAQARVHMGIWQTDEMVFNRQKDGVLREIREAIATALG